MTTTMTIIPQSTDRLFERLQAEIEALAFEIFNLERVDWTVAYFTALADLAGLMAFADDWNDAAANRN